MHEECGCIPAASDTELARMDRWLAGATVLGFPSRDETPFIGHRADEDFLPTDSKSLEAYRRRERLKPRQDGTTGPQTAIQALPAPSRTK